VALAKGANPRGPSDLTMDSLGVVYVSSNDHQFYAANPVPAAGAIYRYDAAKNGVVSRMPIRSESNRLPAYFEKNFFPQGISLIEEGGEKRLFVINHRVDRKRRNLSKEDLAVKLDITHFHEARSLVEIFRIEGKGKKETLVHEATISDAKALADGAEPRGGRDLVLNDIVAVGKRAFFATNNVGGLRQFADIALFRNDINSVVYYSGSKFSAVLDRVGSGTGINISKDKGILYVATSLHGEVIAFRTNLKGTGPVPEAATLEEIEPRIRLGAHLDGIEWTDVRRKALLVAGHPNKIEIGLEHFLPEKFTSPSQIFRVSVGDDGALKKGSAKLVYRNPGDQVSGASVAAYYKGRTKERLIIGSVFDPMFLVCKLEVH
jgi:hypothetical protein